MNQTHGNVSRSNFVFGEMWLRPGLGMRERRLITVICVGFQVAPYPIVSHV